MKIPPPSRVITADQINPELLADLRAAEATHLERAPGSYRRPIRPFTFPPLKKNEV